MIPSPQHTAAGHHRFSASQQAAAASLGQLNDLAQRRPASRGAVPLARSALKAQLDRVAAVEGSERFGGGPLPLGSSELVSVDEYLR